MIAYVSKNNIFPSDTPDRKPSTMEELREQEKIQGMMYGMKPTPIPRGLLPSTAPAPDPVDTDVSWAGDCDWVSDNTPTFNRGEVCPYRLTDEGRRALRSTA